MISIRLFLSCSAGANGLLRVRSALEKQESKESNGQMDNRFVILFSAFMIIGSLATGARWLTDIVGAGLYGL